MRLLLVIAAIMASTTILSAQHPNTRQGFYIGFGVGAGSVGAECNSCDDDDRSSGLSGYFRMGGTVSQHIQLGGDLIGWQNEEDGVEHALGVAAFAANIYPSAKGAFFLKVGLGGMTYAEEEGDDEITARAPGVLFGLGYEFRVARNFALSPYFNAFASAPVRFAITGVDVPSGQEIKLNLVQFGLGLQWF